MGCEMGGVRVDWGGENDRAGGLELQRAIERVSEAVGADELKSQLNVSAFWYQAEEGIRDLTVTGVQTWALPIYDPRPNRKTVLQRGSPITTDCFPVNDISR